MEARTEFSDKVRELLVCLGQELVTLHETECSMVRDRRRVAYSSSNFCDACLPATRDKEAFPPCAKIVRQEFIHCTGTPLIYDAPHHSPRGAVFLSSMLARDRLSATSLGHSEGGAGEESGADLHRVRFSTEESGAQSLFSLRQSGIASDRASAMTFREEATTHNSKVVHDDIVVQTVESDEKPLSPKSSIASFISGDLSSLADDILGGDISEDISKCIFMESGLFYCFWSLQLYLFVALTTWNDTLNLVEEWKNGEGPLGRDFDLIAMVVFWLDIVIHFNTSFEGDNGVVVLSRRKICCHYFRTWFLFDVVAAFPYDWVQGFHSGFQSARMIKIFKFIKLLRMIKILRTSLSIQSTVYVLMSKLDDMLVEKVDDSTMQGLLKLSRLFKAIVRYSLLLFCESHLISCILLSADTGSTRLEFQSVVAEALSPWLHYFAVFRWTLVGCATGITGEYSLRFVVPHIDPQIIRISLTFLFVANMMTGLSLFSNVKGSDDMDLNYRLRMLTLHLRSRVSQQSLKAVVQYHKSQAAKGRAHEIVKLLEDVPEHLRQKVACETYSDQMLKFALFGQGSFRKEKKKARFLLAICHRLQGRFFISKELVITLNHALEGMYCRIDGVLIELGREEAVSDRGRTAVWENDDAHSRLDFFGIEALFTQKSSEAQTARSTVISVNQSEVAVLSRRHFEDVVGTVPDWSAFVRFVRHKVATSVRLQDLASIGISEEHEAEFKHIKKQTAASSREFGISLGYVVNDFASDLALAIDAIDLDTCTFNDLKERFWNEDHQGFRGSATQVCPRDGVLGSAIVDTLDRNFKRKATHFVSWCWRYTVNCVISALGAWAAECDRSKVYLWMCFFCNNQRKLLVDGERVDLVETFAQHLEAVGNMIVLLDRYDAPHYTTRLWCIFEAYTATVKNIPVTVALPRESLLQFDEVVKAPFGFIEVMHALTDIDIEAAKASVKEDELLIKSIIRNSIGFDAVGSTVRGAITRWLASACEHVLMVMKDTTRNTMISDNATTIGGGRASKKVLYM